MTNQPNQDHEQPIKVLYDRLQDLPEQIKPKDLKSISQDFNELCQQEAELEEWDQKKLFLWEGILAAILNEQLAAAIGKTLPTLPSFKLGEKIAVWLKRKKAAPQLKAIAHHYLDFLRTPEFRVRIYDQKKWEPLILDLIEASDFSLRTLFFRNVERYRDRTLFSVLNDRKETRISWQETRDTILRIQAFLDDILPDRNAKIGILMTNSPQMAMLDLACLFSGRVNIMIPSNSTPEHIAFILNQTEAMLLFVSDSQLLEKIKVIKSDLLHLEKVVFLLGRTSDPWVVPFSLPKVSDMIPEQEMVPLNMNNLATLMYTSGTTGEPKGIMFSQRNIIYKRFCRALAIPKIGPKDRFLCFLPLFHTFGRYFEMTGCIFWGSQYVFMENPSVKTMVSNMKQMKPTVFISIPRKWIQLYELVGKKVNLEIESPEVIKQTLDDETGGELKWGLSAAGYLPADIFNFFQQNGIQLMSGFGMTEATGGITMTPPGEYKPNSLGKALPGIELKLADDGELLIRGPYVMLGYFNKDGQDSFLPDNWLPTGDIMKKDSYGCLEIIDRKKEIYKNVRGETVAPQKVENLFRDFEEIQQVFLVGDHRPYNTVLLFPNPEKKDFFEQLDSANAQDYFSTVVSTVNRFLSPFERILDYRVIDRPISSEHGELTSKNTFRRKVIEENFSHLIESMYEKNYHAVIIKDLELRIPNWFLSEKGILSRDLRSTSNSIRIPKLNLELEIIPFPESRQCQIGEFSYTYQGNYFDFQPLLINPALWCGNQRLYQFAGRSILQWQREIKHVESVSINHCIENASDLQEEMEWGESLKNMFLFGEQSTLGIHFAAKLLRSSEENLRQLAIDYFRMIVQDQRATELAITVLLLSRPQLSPDLFIRRKMLITLLESPNLVNPAELFKRFLNTTPEFLDSPTISIIIAKYSDKGAPQVFTEIIESEIQKLKKGVTIHETSLPGLLKLLTQFGVQHPTSFKEIRQHLVAYQLVGHNLELAQMALMERKCLREGFREWLGPNQDMAIGHESGEEYTWDDVISFEEQIDPKDKERIRKVIQETPLIREAIFLFSGKGIVRLQDMQRGGIWVSFIRRHQKKAVYRMSIQTRFQGAFDLTLNLNNGIPIEKVLEEVDWLILAASKAKAGQTLVEDFGGFFEEYGIWSEEYLIEPTVEKFLNRQARKKNSNVQERITHIWPFFVWNATTAFLRFWKLTNYETMIAKPSPENIIIPPHDYQRGTRLVSLTERVQETSFLAFFHRFKTYFMDRVTKGFPYLGASPFWKFFFSGVISVEEEETGKVILRSLRRDIIQSEDFNQKEAIVEELNEFLGELEDFGYNPKSLTFAIRRFHRWFQVNRNASFEAQATMLNELYNTYSLYALHPVKRDVRTRFYLQTVLEDADPWVIEELFSMAKKLKHGLITQGDTHAIISRIIRQSESLSEKDHYFLTRLSYPHLAPTTEAELLHIEAQESILLVQLEDQDGEPYSIRQPVNPKEISKLFQLFVKANLHVQFRAEHHFLVAVSERGHLIGGLFYQYMEDNSVHMDKIVVSNHFRRKGISEGLMDELFKRLKSDHIEYISTGFFRPEYFYKFGFKTEAKHSGLVKVLNLPLRNIP